MSNKGVYLLGIIVIANMLFVGNVFPVIQGNGIGVSAPNLEIFIDLDDLDDNNVFYDESFYFRVNNDEPEPITVKPRFEVLHLENWQNNFTNVFNSDEEYLLPGEDFVFIPEISINVELSANYSLHFIFEGYRNNGLNGTVNLVASHGRQANFVIESEYEGYKFTVRTTDQGDIERRSEITIQYGGNDEVGQGWRAFKHLQFESYYSSVVRVGWYQVIATEFSTKDQKSEIILVNDSTNLNIVFELITMTFEFELPTIENRKEWNFTYIVENKYSALYDVQFVFQVYDSTGNKSITEPYVQNLTVFDKGSLKSAKLTFTNDWQTGDYIFKGEIYVKGTKYYEIPNEVRLDFPLIEDFLQSPYFPIAVLGITFMAGGLVIGLIMRFHYKPKTNTTPKIELKNYDREEKQQLEEFEKIKKEIEHKQDSE